MRPVVNVCGCDSCTVPSLAHGAPGTPLRGHDRREDLPVPQTRMEMVHRAQRQEMSALGVDASGEEMQSSIVTVTGDPSSPPPPTTPSKANGRLVSAMTVGAHDGTTHQPGRRAS